MRGILDRTSLAFDKFPRTVVGVDLLDIVEPLLKKAMRANRGTVPKDNELLARPGECHIHAAGVAKEADFVAGVGSY